MRKIRLGEFVCLLLVISWWTRAAPPVRPPGVTYATLSCARATSGPNGQEFMRSVNRPEGRVHHWGNRLYLKGQLIATERSTFDLLRQALGPPTQIRYPGPPEGDPNML